MSERELTQSPWVHNTGGVGTVSNGGGGGRGEGRRSGWETNGRTRSVPHTSKKYTWVVKSKSGVAVNTW